jgi:aspartate-semialdehyde dehydrogenase
MFGHTATLHITFDHSISSEDILEKYKQWNQKYNNLFVIHSADGRPQSLRDLEDDDMRIHIGSLRQGDRKNIIGLTILSHNLVRGAAGAVIANMESYLRAK